MNRHTARNAAMHLLGRDGRGFLFFQREMLFGFIDMAYLK